MRLTSAKAVTYGAMWAFFLPLAASQVLQQVRHPLLDAGIARGLEPAASLAAFGVVSGVVQILGAAGIAVQSAYLVLVRGRRSYVFMRRYTAVYTLGIVALTLVTALPGSGPWFFEQLMGASTELTPRVVQMMQIAALVPVCNLARLFYVAQLAHLRQTRVVWVAPAVSVALLAVLALGVIPNVPVAASTAGAVAWLVIAAVEALVLGWLAHRASRRAPYGEDPPGQLPLDARQVTWFVLPLIATQFSLAAGLPLTNAGLLRLAEPETSVAAMRVAMSLIMVSNGGAGHAAAGGAGDGARPTRPCPRTRLRRRHFAWSGRGYGAHRLHARGPVRAGRGDRRAAPCGRGGAAGAADLRSWCPWSWGCGSSTPVSRCTSAARPWWPWRRAGVWC